MLEKLKQNKTKKGEQSDGLSITWLNESQPVSKRRKLLKLVIYNTTYKSKQILYHHSYLQSQGKTRLVTLFLGENHRKQYRYLTNVVNSILHVKSASVK